MKRRDFLSPEQRSRRMSLIKGKNTLPERAMARLLRKASLKYHGHWSRLPGSPDFALRDAHVAVFVDGAFWHGRYFERWEHKLNPYWRERIITNIRRDRRNFAKLRQMGWSVVRVWDVDLAKRQEWCLRRVRRALGRLQERTMFRTTRENEPDLNKTKSLNSERSRDCAESVKVEA